MSLAPICLLLSSLLFTLSAGFKCDVVENSNTLSPEVLAYHKSKSSWTCEGVPCCVNGKICDKYLGCFYQGTKTPWCHQGALPWSPEKIEAEFWVFGPGGIEWIIDYAQLDISVSELTLDTSRELWILVHGFGQDWPKTWMFPMKDALVAKGHNVIICRWTKGSAAPDYFQATANTRMMGAIVGRVANSMKDHQKLNLVKTTILGFSLGAHVAGFAGSYLPGLQKVIGIDPAGPLYGGCGSVARLNNTDAQFVMAIHCNGESLWDGGCGTMEPLGHIDFYANGGQVQHVGEHQGSTGVDNKMQAQAGGCKFKGYPCGSTDDWLQGQCFNCDEHLGCPVPGYDTTNDTLFTGTYYFGTLATNDTDYDYCGHNFKLTLLAKSPAKGKVTINVKGSDYSTGSIKLVDGSLAPGRSSSHVLHAPWDAQFPTEVEVGYSTEWLFLYNIFKVASVQVVRDDGKIFATSANAEIKRETTVTMKLSPLN